MPLYQLDIEKSLGTETWTNVYHVNAGNLESCRDAIGLISVAEKTFHGTVVTFTRGRARTKIEGDDNYIIVPIGGQGARDLGQYLPLFNTFNVLWGAAQGRPSRKYYRGPLSENDQAGGVLQGTIATQINTALNGLINNMPDIGCELVDVDGDVLLEASAQLVVGMRQLRRGSKRRLQPILPLA